MKIFNVLLYKDIIFTFILMEDYGITMSSLRYNKNSQAFNEYER